MALLPFSNLSCRYWLLYFKKKRRRGGGELGKLVVCTKSKLTDAVQQRKIEQTSDATVCSM